MNETPRLVCVSATFNSDVRRRCRRAAHIQVQKENMSSSDDGEPQVPMMTVVHARSGADFEAGRGGRPRGEHIKGRA